MKFRLDYTPPESPFKINHTSRVLLAGSCFAENIGKRLAEHRFQTTINPGGIFFDPLSLCRFFSDALNGKAPSDYDFIERDGHYFSYAFHSSVSARTKDELIATINNIYVTAQRNLKEADFIFLSFGTALVHHLREGERPVANCHKQHAQKFSKKLLGPDQLASACHALISQIQKVNSNCKNILTVSPVKYLRDGPVNNNLSKACLLLMTRELCESSGCFYFPAFELLNDDLRDYRFYKEDLSHPNELAVSYIWEKFRSAFFSPLTQEVVHEIEALNRSLTHRPLRQLPAEEAKLRESIHRQKERILALDPAVRL